MAEQSQEIKEITIAELDPRLAKNIANAENSLAKNPDYTIDICNTVLNKYPNCVEVRKILRQAQYRKYGKGSPIAKIIASIKSFLLSTKADSMIKKNQALELLNMAEALMNECPDNPVAVKVLVKAAEALNYLGVAATGYQAIVQYAPTEANLIALANAYIKNKQPDEAMQIAESVLVKNRANGEAQAIARTASVMKTMNKGKWEEGGSAKDKVKDADAQLERERQTSTVNDDETVAKFVEDLKVKIAEDEQNINLYKDICRYLRQLKRYSEALEYVRMARKQPLGAGDTTFEKLEKTLMVQEMEQARDALQQQLDADSNNAELATKLKEANDKIAEIKLNNAKEQVERYPNDYEARFQLGKLYLEASVLDEAIKQLQTAQRSPKHRMQSLLGLGRAFSMGGKFDLAVDQLITAKNESKLMNDDKKEVIYELASTYEKMGNKDAAFAEYKEIYQIDASYKDVSAKVDFYYSQK